MEDGRVSIGQPRLLF